MHGPVVFGGAGVGCRVGRSGVPLQRAAGLATNWVAVPMGAGAGQAGPVSRFGRTVVGVRLAVGVTVGFGLGDFAPGGQLVHLQLARFELDGLPLGGGNGGGGDSFMSEDAGGKLGSGEASNGGIGGKPADGGMMPWCGEAGEALAEGLALEEVLLGQTGGGGADDLPDCRFEGV